MSFLLAQVLSDPDRVAALDLRQYEQLVRQARCTNLLPAVADRIQSADLMSVVTDAVARHLVSATVVQTKQQQDLDFNITKLQHALG